MKKLLASIIDRHSKLVLFVIFAMTLAMIPGLKKIQVISQPQENGFTNPNEYVRSVMEVKKTFGANSRTVVLAVEAQGNHTLLEPEAVQIINEMTNKLRMVPAIRRETIISLATMSEVENTKDGINSTPLYKKAPTNVFELEELKKKISANEFIFGRLISKDFKTTMVVANASEEGSLYKLHDDLAAALKDNLTPKGAKDVSFKVNLAGDTEVNYQLETNVQKDAVLFLGIAMLLIIGSFYFMFNTWKGVVLLIASMIVGISWTMGAIGFYGEPISILSAMLPVVIVVIGSSYAIHVFHALTEHAQHAAHFAPAFRKVLDKLLSPLMMSTSTTIVGGLSLLSFKLKMIQHFGVFTALGTAVTFMVSVLLIPAMYRVLRKPIQKMENSLEKTVVAGVDHAKAIAHSTMQMIPVAGAVTEAVSGTVQASISGGVRGFWSGLMSGNLIERGLKGVAKIVAKHPWYIIAATGVFVVISAVNMSKVQIGFDNIALLPNNYEIKGVMQRLDKSFNGIQGFDMLLDSGKSGGALDPEFMKKVDEFNLRARKLNNVTHVFSIVDVLKKMDTILNNEAKNASHIPSSKDTAAQYLFLLSSSGGGLSTNGMLTSDQRKIRVNITTNVTDTAKIETIYEELKVMTAEVFGSEVKADIGGGLVANVGLLHYVVWGKIQNIMISLLLILLIVSAVYRSFSRGLLSIFALPIGVVANFGLMGYVGIRLDIVTAIITSFAMGVGVDFSIHFLSALKAEYEKHEDLEVAIEKAITGPGLSIAYNAISTKIGFSALMFSHFASIHTFATLMCFNMMILALAALTLLPAVVRIIEPECITGYREKHRIPERKWNFAMKVALNTIVCGALLTGIVVVNAKAETTPDVQTIMKKSVQAIYTPNEESVYVMKLVDSSGGVSIRKMKVWFKSANDGDAKLLIKFAEPADIRGTGFLTVAQKGKSPDQYLYLPALKKSRRLGGSGNADEPFLGSDFSMGDLSAGGDDGLEYKVAGTQKVEGSDCYEIVGTPKAGADKSAMVYSKKVYLIRKDNFLGVKGQFFNQAGQLEKEMTIPKISKEGSRFVANQIEMKNLLTKHSTVLEFEKRDSSKQIPDSVFTVSYLEKN